MRFVLAILSFLLAFALLAYAGLVAFGLYTVSEFRNDPNMANWRFCAWAGALVRRHRAAHY